MKDGSESVVYTLINEIYKLPIEESIGIRFLIIVVIGFYLSLATGLAMALLKE